MKSLQAIGCALWLLSLCALTPVHAKQDEEATQQIILDKDYQANLTKARQFAIARNYQVSAIKPLATNGKKYLIIEAYRGAVKHTIKLEYPTLKIDDESVAK